MELETLQTLIGDLTNDPAHDRYSLDQINIELNNSQNKWNIGAGILKDTADYTLAAGQNSYNIVLTIIPIAFTRVTHRGLALLKKDKNFFDLYAGGEDWTLTSGTPKYYFIMPSDPDHSRIYVYPTPTDADTDVPLVVEFVRTHTPMGAGENPFNGLTLINPYHYGLAYDVASRLLVRDPSPLNAQKVIPYLSIADRVFADVVTVFKAFEKEIPMRLKSIYRPVGQAANGWRTG